MVKERQRLQDLDQDLADDVQIEPLVILSFDETVEIEAEHLSDDAHVASEFEIAFYIDYVLVC